MNNETVEPCINVFIYVNNCFLSINNNLIPSVFDLNILSNFYIYLLLHVLRLLIFHHFVTSAKGALGPIGMCLGYRE